MSPVVAALTRYGALSSSDLLRLLTPEVGSQRTYERALAGTPGLIRLGSKRQRVYALARPEVLPSPVFMCDEEGTVQFVGNLLALQANQWTWDQTGERQRWMSLGQLGEQVEVYQGLPWFMEPFRPAGFLGRTWVREHADAHGWSLDIQSWTDDQILTAALQAPWDWRGNLSLGAFVEPPNYLVDASARRDEFARRADLILDGVMVGASADGEQPKFTAVVVDGRQRRPVLVKFSQRMTNDPAARRWGDIMLTEAVAQQVMALHGLESAATDVWMHDDRIWLETTRFDRVGENGRRGMASLRALAQSYHYQGPQNGWVTATEHLCRKGALAEADVVRIQHIATIGHLMLNTDMHMGNMSFIPGLDWPYPLRVAPVYDMTPMRWAPVGTRNAIPPLAHEPLFKTDDIDALMIAAEIWEETSRRELATDGWRAWARQRALQIRERLEA